METQGVSLSLLPLDVHLTQKNEHSLGESENMSFFLSHVNFFYFPCQLYWQSAWFCKWSQNITLLEQVRNKAGEGQVGVGNRRHSKERLGFDV